MVKFKYRVAILKGKQNSLTVPWVRKPIFTEQAARKSFSCKAITDKGIHDRDFWKDIALPTRLNLKHDKRDTIKATYLRRIFKEFGEGEKFGYRRDLSFLNEKQQQQNSADEKTPGGDLNH